MMNRMEALQLLALTSPVYVMPDFDDGWDVIYAGQVVFHHRTQEAAVTVGRRLARQQKTELTVWGRNGRIRSKDSYGNETPAPDKEH